MVGLDDNSREMILNGIKMFAERNLSEEFLLDLDKKGEDLPKDKIKEMFFISMASVTLLN